MDLLKLLEWDTSFFGFPIAKIQNPHAEEKELREAVAEMRSRGIPLAYWFADKPSAESQAAVTELGGVLVDEKLTFMARLSAVPRQLTVPLSIVEPYREGMSLADLKALAVESGRYSRFVVDQKFPKPLARALFEEWIVRSISKRMADEVLVVRQQSTVIGMVTISSKGHRGSIGLLAVAESCRGQNLGGALVQAAMIWCRGHNLEEVQVVTQETNIPAQRLYQKCGFELEQKEFCYHIWSTGARLPA